LPDGPAVPQPSRRRGPAHAADPARIRLHDLRHGAATCQAAAGEPWQHRHSIVAATGGKPAIADQDGQRIRPVRGELAGLGIKAQRRPASSRRKGRPPQGTFRACGAFAAVATRAALDDRDLVEPYRRLRVRDEDGGPAVRPATARYRPGSPISAISRAAALGFTFQAGQDLAPAAHGAEGQRRRACAAAGRTAGRGGGRVGRIQRVGQFVLVPRSYAYLAGLATGAWLSWLALLPRTRSSTAARASNFVEGGPLASYVAGTCGWRRRTSGDVVLSPAGAHCSAAKYVFPVYRVIRLSQCEHQPVPDRRWPTRRAGICGVGAAAGAAAARRGGGLARAGGAGADGCGTACPLAGRFLPPG
jgi:hypothetical protein